MRTPLLTVFVILTGAGRNAIGRGAIANGDRPARGTAGVDAPVTRLTCGPRNPRPENRTATVVELLTYDPSAMLPAAVDRNREAVMPGHLRRRREAEQSDLARHGRAGRQGRQDGPVRPRRIGGIFDPDGVHIIDRAARAGTDICDIEMERDRRLSLGTIVRQTERGLARAHRQIRQQSDPRQVRRVRLCARRPQPLRRRASAATASVAPRRRLRTTHVRASRSPCIQAPRQRLTNGSDPRAQAGSPNYLSIVADAIGELGLGARGRRESAVRGRNPAQAGQHLGNQLEGHGLAEQEALHFVAAQEATARRDCSLSSTPSATTLSFSEWARGSMMVETRAIGPPGQDAIMPTTNERSILSASSGSWAMWLSPE